MFGGAAQTTIVTLINVVLTYFYTNVMGLNIAKVAPYYVDQPIL